MTEATLEETARDEAKTAAYEVTGQRLVARSRDESRLLAEFADRFEEALGSDLRWVEIDLAEVGPITAPLARLVSLIAYSSEQDGVSVSIVVDSDGEAVFRADALGSLLDLHVGRLDRESKTDLDAYCEELERRTTRALLREHTSKPEPARAPSRFERPRTGQIARRPVVRDDSSDGEASAPAPNRRKTGRFEIQAGQVLWREVNAPDPRRKSRSVLVDLSRRGAQFYSNRPMACGVSLLLKISGNTLPERVRVGGKVVHCEKAQIDGQVLYRVGVNFDSLQKGRTMLQLSRAERTQG